MRHVTTDGKTIITTPGRRAERVIRATIALMLGMAPCAWAATDDRAISGYVQHEDLRRVADATVTVRDQEGRRVTETTTNTSGEFAIVAPPAGAFSVRARLDNYRSAAVVLTVDLDVTKPLVLTMTDARELELDVVAPRAAARPRTSGETVSISRHTIEALPKGDNADLRDVLAILPGATNGALGQVHIRQEHAGLQFRVDGVPIPDTVTSQFTDVIHPRTWERAEVVLGGMEAQYGNRTTAVIDVTSKSGTTPGFFSSQVFGGGNETVQTALEYGGAAGDRFRWYLMNTYLTTNRGIEPPVLDRTASHDHGERNQTYLRADYQLNNRQNLTWLLLNGVADYQIPTQPGQIPNPELTELIRAHTAPRFTPASSDAIDENQSELNQYSHLVWRYDINPNRFVSVAGYFRHSRATFTTDPLNVLAYTDDEEEPFSAGHQDRWGVAGGVRIDYTHAIGSRHVLKAGMQLDRTSATNKTRLFVFAREEEEEEEEEEEPGMEHHHGGEPTGAVLGRGADRRILGYRQEFWVQDQFTPDDRWTVNVGLRLDHVHGYIDAMQVSPRVGVTFAINDHHTLRAFYGRLFTPPALEAVPLLALNLDGTTGAPEDPTNIRPNAERSHAVEIGSTHVFGKTAVLQLAGYYKFNTDMTDAHQFNTTPMLNYFAYQRGWNRGIEGTLLVTPADGLTARGAVAWGQCKGKGLQSGHFLLHEEELADIQTSEGIFCDHSQAITSSALVTYRLLPRTTISGQMLFGSGLRSHVPGAKTNSGHADSHTIYNVSVTHVMPLTRRHSLLLGVDAINLFDQRELLNIGERSVGLGVSHANMPRSIFFRAQWMF